MNTLCDLASDKPTEGKGRNNVYFSPFSVCWACFAVVGSEASESWSWDCFASAADDGRGLDRGAELGGAD